jgi:hypothetical protein
MSFTYRFRKPTSIITLAALLVTGTVTPASAEYIPHLGRWAQRDPNGAALVLDPALVHHGASPMVTISMAYELQFADGMNFYQFVRSNPAIGTDPSGMFTYADLMTSQSVSAWVRTSMKFAAIGTVGAGVFGGLRSGYEAQLMGGNAKQIAAAAVRGAGYTGYKAFARVLIASAMIASGPGGLALAGGIGLFESAEAYGEARERQELAQTQEDLSLATFDSVFATLGVGGSLYGASVGIRGAAIAARASLPRLPQGNTGVWQGTFKGARFRADVVRKGSELQLNNVAFEGPIGVGGYKSLIDAAKLVARDEGFTTLRVFAVRRSGANRGGWIDQVYKID